jgi:hypothetical protein
MKTKQAKKELEKIIKQSGKPLSSLTPAQGMRLMLDFYRDIRADGCDLEGDGDMLLFQWGVYDSDAGRSFQFDLTRQFMLEDCEDDDGMTQLSLTFHFEPSPKLEALADGNQWCHAPDGLGEFETFITGSSAYGSVATASPKNVTLNFGGV